MSANMRTIRASGREGVAKLPKDFAPRSQCDELVTGESGEPAGRQIRKLVAPVLAARAIGRALATRPTTSVDRQREGIWSAHSIGWRQWSSTARIAIDGLDIELRPDAPQPKATSKPWRAHLVPGVAPVQVPAAALPIGSRLTEADRRFALTGDGRRQPDRRHRPACRSAVSPEVFTTATRCRRAVLRIRVK